MTTNTTKGRKFPPEPLTRGEVHALISTLSTRSTCGLRNRALLWTLYRAGLRISEALDLRLKDLERPKVRVLRGKGGKMRTVAMSPDAWGAVEAWLERRRTLELKPGAPVFCALHGARLGHGYIRQVLARAKAGAGLEKRVHAHGLRHTLASELAEEGRDVMAIMGILGHANLSQTTTYLQRLGATPRIIDAMVSRPSLVEAPEEGWTCLGLAG